MKFLSIICCVILVLIGAQIKSLQLKTTKTVFIKSYTTSLKDSQLEPSCKTFNSFKLSLAPRIVLTFYECISQVSMLFIAPEDMIAIETIISINFIHICGAKI